MSKNKAIYVMLSNSINNIDKAIKYVVINNRLIIIVKENNKYRLYYCKCTNCKTHTEYIKTDQLLDTIPNIQFTGYYYYFINKNQIIYTLDGIIWKNLDFGEEFEKIQKYDKLGENTFIATLKQEDKNNKSVYPMDKNNKSVYPMDKNNKSNYIIINDKLEWYIYKLV